MKGPSSQRERLRNATFWTLFVGYGAYYLCRANLGVASPLLQSELHYDKLQIGAISTASTFAYALGKFTLGPTADVVLGGKRVFLLGLAGAIVANVLFGLSTGLWVFVVIWSLNRFVQSGGWMGLVQLVSGWYERSRYGVVMAWLSLSFLFGDAAARGLSALLLRAGLGWRALFFVPAGLCAVFLLVASRTLTRPPKEDPLRSAEPRLRTTRRPKARRRSAKSSRRSSEAAGSGSPAASRSSSPFFGRCSSIGPRSTSSTREPSRGRRRSSRCCSRSRALPGRSSPAGTAIRVFERRGADRSRR